MKCIRMHDRFKFHATLDKCYILSKGHFFYLITSCDLIIQIICIMVFAMHRGELNKHFDGSFVVIC